jgi:nitrogen fixation NifU-like protein
LGQGHLVGNAWNITDEMVKQYLQTLPEDHYHCAELCVGAFYLALTDYQKKKAKKESCK